MMLSALRQEPSGKPSRLAYALYLACVLALLGRITWIDEWSLARFVVLAVFLATLGPERVKNPTLRSLGIAVAFFVLLSSAFMYLPDLWFAIAFQLNHAKNYLWNANAFMQLVPGNDGRFLWGHRVGFLSDLFGWIYKNGFDMVVWIPVTRSLLAFDTRKFVRYSLAAHLIQFPLIMPFYTMFRVDEVWSVLGDPDRLGRGWSDEVRLDLGANCFPSMHTSVAFAILLLGLRENSRVFRVLMAIYATSIIVSTVYMEVHWLIDLAGGLLLGWGSVWLSDRIVAPTAALTTQSTAHDTASDAQPEAN